jgi:hypothetical protein
MSVPDHELEDPACDVLECWHCGIVPDEYGHCECFEDYGACGEDTDCTDYEFDEMSN